jgi:hypothetical protein
VKELDEAHTAYVRDIGQSEESHWRMVWIFQDRANAAAEECERLEAENKELRQTINALRHWNWSAPIMVRSLGWRSKIEVARKGQRYKADIRRAAHIIRDAWEKSWREQYGETPEPQKFFDILDHEDLLDAVKNALDPELAPPGDETGREARRRISDGLDELLSFIETLRGFPNTISVRPDPGDTSNGRLH